MGEDKPLMIQGMLLHGDWDFIDRVERMVPGMTRRQVRDAYKREFLDAYHAEPTSYRKANAGRRAANLWLRKAAGLD